MTYRMLLKTICIVLLAVLAGLFYVSTSFLGGRLYVQCILALAILFDLIILFDAFATRGDAGKQPGPGEAAADAERSEKKIPMTFQVGVLLLLPLVAVMAWEKLSFLVSSLLCSYILLRICANSRTKSLIVATVSVLILQVIFVNIFMVSLPTPGWWPR